MIDKLFDQTRDLPRLPQDYLRKIVESRGTEGHNKYRQRTEKVPA